MEPEANGTEILNALKYVRPGGGFVPNFQMFKICDVNGKNEIPLYTYLKVSSKQVASVKVLANESVVSLILNDGFAKYIIVLI